MFAALYQTWRTAGGPHVGSEADQGQLLEQDSDATRLGEFSEIFQAPFRDFDPF
jgi:hypothetical protein